MKKLVKTLKINKFWYALRNKTWNWGEKLVKSQNAENNQTFDLTGKIEKLHMEYYGYSRWDYHQGFECSRI